MIPVNPNLMSAAASTPFSLGASPLVTPLASSKTDRKGFVQGLWEKTHDLRFGSILLERALGSGRLEEAERLVSEAELFNGNHPEVLYNKARIKTLKGEYVEAQNFLEELFKVSPTHLNGWMFWSYLVSLKINAENYRMIHAAASSKVEAVFKGDSITAKALISLFTLDIFEKKLSTGKNRGSFLEGPNTPLTTFGRLMCVDFNINDAKKELLLQFVNNPYPFPSEFAPDILIQLLKCGEFEALLSWCEKHPDLCEENLSLLTLQLYVHLFRKDDVKFEETAERMKSLVSEVPFQEFLFYSSEQARVIFEKDLLVHPDLPPKHLVALGDLFFEMKEFQAASRFYIVAVQVLKQDFLLCAKMGQSLSLCPDADKNKEKINLSFKTATERAPTLEEVVRVSSRMNLRDLDQQVLVALAYLRLKSYSLALRAIDDALKLDPAQATAWQIRGRICDEAGWRERAYASFRQSVRLDPKNVESVHRLTRLAILMEVGLEGYREAFKRMTALENIPDPVLKYHRETLILIADLVGEYAVLEQTLEEHLKAYPEAEIFRLRRAYVHLARFEYKEAKSDLERIHSEEAKKLLLWIQALSRPSESLNKLYIKLVKTIETAMFAADYQILAVADEERDLKKIEKEKIEAELKKIEAKKSERLPLVRQFMWQVLKKKPHSHAALMIRKNPRGLSYLDLQRVCLEKRENLSKTVNEEFVGFNEELEVLKACMRANNIQGAMVSLYALLKASDIPKEMQEERRIQSIRERLSCPTKLTFIDLDHCLTCIKITPNQNFTRRNQKN